jgi:transcriptional regulator with XRE-family HTH domain
MGSLGSKLKLARELSGKTEREVAAALGISVPSYYDLETFDDELETCLSLAEVSKLCSLLRIDPVWLFTEGDLKGSSRMRLSELVDNIRSFIGARMTVDEFEDKVGFVVSPCFEDWHAVLEWNVECLRSVCSVIGIDWLAALPCL